MQQVWASKFFGIFLLFLLTLSEVSSAWPRIMQVDPEGVLPNLELPGVPVLPQLTPGAPRNIAQQALNSSRDARDTAITGLNGVMAGREQLTQATNRILRDRDSLMARRNDTDHMVRQGGATPNAANRASYGFSEADQARLDELNRMLSEDIPKLQQQAQEHLDFYTDRLREIQENTQQIRDYVAQLSKGETGTHTHTRAGSGSPGGSSGGSKGGGGLGLLGIAAIGAGIGLAVGALAAMTGGDDEDSVPELLTEESVTTEVSVEAQIVTGEELEDAAQNGEEDEESAISCYSEVNPYIEAECGTPQALFCFDGEGESVACPAGNAS